MHKSNFDDRDTEIRSSRLHLKHNNLLERKQTNMHAIWTCRHYDKLVIFQVFKIRFDQMNIFLVSTTFWMASRYGLFVETYCPHFNTSEVYSSVYQCLFVMINPDTMITKKNYARRLRNEHFYHSLFQYQYKKYNVNTAYYTKWYDVI